MKVAGRCIDHDELAWRYGDGSVMCLYCLVVETSSEHCRFGDMPPEWLTTGKYDGQEDDDESEIS
jgi:hypothetical protein